MFCGELLWITHAALWSCKYLFVLGKINIWHRYLSTNYSSSEVIWVIYVIICATGICVFLFAGSILLPIAELGNIIVPTNACFLVQYSLHFINAIFLCNIFLRNILWAIFLCNYFVQHIFAIFLLQYLSVANILCGSLLIFPTAWSNWMCDC